MRVTPDTGILVRMNVKASGPARRLLEIILAGPHELVLSEFLLEETARVLGYPVFKNCMIWRLKISLNTLSCYARVQMLFRRSSMNQS